MVPKRSATLSIFAVILSILLVACSSGTPAATPAAPATTPAAGASASAAAVASTAAGEIWGWGAYDSSAPAQSTPMALPGGLTGVASIAVGEKHILALKGDGTVWAGGYNNLGQLGNGTTSPTPELTPVLVKLPQGTKATHVAAGGAHSLAVTDKGEVYAWGENKNGELGDGATANQSTPLLIKNLANVRFVAAGVGASLAIDSDGTVWAWGKNDNGQLGDGGTLPSQGTPRKVAMPSGIGPVAFVASWTAGTAAITQDGKLVTWYKNTPPNHETIFADPLKAVDLGTDHQLALKADGTVWGWGDTAYGQVGNGQSSGRVTGFVQISIPTKVKDIASGAHHSMALTEDGKVYAWGKNDKGQLGDGKTANVATPQLVPGLTGVRAIAAGGDFSLALGGPPVAAVASAVPTAAPSARASVAPSAPASAASATATRAPAASVAPSAPAAGASGTIWGWGSDEVGQLGNGTGGGGPTPTSLTLANVTAIATGDHHTLALKSDGTVWAWGHNDLGQLGDKTTTDRQQPVQVSLPAGTKVTAITTSYDHSLALTDKGEVYAWGYNRSVPATVPRPISPDTVGVGAATLGTGSDKAFEATPALVQGLSGTVTAIAVGQHHGLALIGGKVFAWGENQYGQLGNESTTDQIKPVQVKDLEGVKQIAAGQAFSLAITRDDRVAVWGINNEGLLGTGKVEPIANQTIPVVVNGPTNVVALSGGTGHTLALTREGNVWSWGENNHGQIGNGTQVNQPAPKQVAGLSGVKAISASTFYSLALLNNGSIMGWGQNDQGQLGIAGVNLITTPTAMPGLTGVQAIAAGERHSIALGGTLAASAASAAPSATVARNGAVWTWGENTAGQLGDGTKTNRLTPAQVNNLRDVTAIALGQNYALALKKDGTVVAWGGNNVGQLGIGSNADQSAPTPVSDLKDVKAIAAGYTHSLALKTDGTIWAWGANDFGKLGDGKSANLNKPVQLTGLPKMKAIAAGQLHSLVVAEDGSVYAWGANGDGRLGDGTPTNRSTPVKLATPTNVQAVAAGQAHSLALTNDGKVWAWGDNTNGQVGDGANADRNTPVVLTTLTDVTTIAAGQSHSVAVKKDGTAWVWGRNNSGQLGLGSNGDQNAPKQVSGLTDVIAIEAGVFHTLALKKDGTVWAWGDNTNGQVGSGGGGSITTPRQVPNAAAITAIAAGGGSSFALVELATP